MSTFLAGLRSRRWLNLGVFVLGVLAMVVAVATPLYARASAEHLLDQRTAQRPVVETGLSVETAPEATEGRTIFVSVADVSPAAGQHGKKPEPLTEDERQQMLARVTDLVSTDAANSYWQPPTTYLLSQGQYLSGGRSYQINTYWRDGMCDRATIEGKCPSAPGEALIDPVMLRTIGGQVGDSIRVMFTGFNGKGNPVKEYPADYTIVGTYTIDDDTSTYWFDPSHTRGDGTLRPPPLGSPGTPLIAPALLVDGSSITMKSATVGGADRPVDLDRLDLATMDDAEVQLQTWQTSIADQGSPILQPDDPLTFQALFEDVRAEQELLSRVTLAAVVPLVVLALLLLYVLVASAAEVRRQEVALAKLRGFTSRKVVRFAVAEPAAVLLVTVPVGIVLAVLAERTVSKVWLGSTPFTVTPQAVASAVVVTATALLAAFVAVLGVVREPLSASLASVTRRRSSSRWALLAQGALVMLSVAAVVQVVTSEATESTSFLELLTPLFVALGASVVAMVLIGLVARAWMRRTADRGGLSPFLASRRLVRRQDLAQLVLPLLLATAMATFAASAWKVADDWRVSKAAATVGAATVYFTDTSPSRLQWVTQQADPDGQYLAAAVPPSPRTIDGGRVALVDATRFARVAAWDAQWGTNGPDQVQDWLTPGRVDPITFSGSHVAVSIRSISLTGKLNFPLEVWLRYVPSGTGEERLATLGKIPRRGSVRLDGFVSECADGCAVQQLFIAGSSSSVSDAAGRLTITRIAADGDDPGDWRLGDASAWRAARPFGDSGLPPVSLASAGGSMELRMTGEPALVRLTTTDVPEAPPVVSTTSSDLDPVDGAGADAVDGASLLGARTPMALAGRAEALPLVGNNGGLSDLTAALREYGDQSSDVSITELLVADGTPTSVLAEVRKLGVPLTDRRTEAEELHDLRSDAFSLGWRVFLLVGALTLGLAFLGVLALAVVQLRWRSYEVAALRVVGVRRRDLRRAIVVEYLALLGMAVVGGALAAITALLLVLPSLDIGEIGDFDPPVDYALRWVVMAGVVGAVLVVVLAIALWIARRTVKQGTPATLRQADAR